MVHRSGSRAPATAPTSAAGPRGAPPDGPGPAPQTPPGPADTSPADTAATSGRPPPGQPLERPDRRRLRLRLTARTWARPASRCSSANVTGSIFPLALIGAVSCIAFYEPPYLAVCQSQSSPPATVPSPAPLYALRYSAVRTDACRQKGGSGYHHQWGSRRSPEAVGRGSPPRTAAHRACLACRSGRRRIGGRRAGPLPDLGQSRALADVRASPARDTSRAMSQENAEVVRRMLRAFNDGDVERIVAESDPAVEWEEQSIPGVEPLYRGHDGARRWGAAVLGVREELGPPPRALRGSQGDRRPGDRLRLF